MPEQEEFRPEHQAFGQAVRERRDDLGLSQEKLGYRAALDRTYVSGIERGVRNPTMRIVWKLARALDTKPSTLLTEAEALLDADAG